jgi:hypothetical protein
MYDRNVQNAAFSDERSSLAAIARDLLVRRPGDRIPTVVEYQERLGIGSGTVQARLRTLVTMGAIGVLPRGHQGTILVSRNLPELWHLGQLGPISGILPLPEAIEPVSLAAVLRRAFQRLTIPLELLYLHGAAKRIELVRNGAAHFTITSRPAAEDLAGGSAGWLPRDLGAESYHRVDSMVVLVGPRAASGERIERVGIDPTSHDHSLLTRLEFPIGDGYRHLPFAHARLPAAVTEGRIDAAVWLRTTLAIPLSAVGIVTRRLGMPQAVVANEALGRAVLVARDENEGVAAVLREIDLDDLRAIQDEILGSDVLPLY